MSLTAQTFAGISPGFARLEEKSAMKEEPAGLELLDEGPDSLTFLEEDSFCLDRLGCLLLLEDTPDDLVPLKDGPTCLVLLDVEDLLSLTSTEELEGLALLMTAPVSCLGGSPEKKTH